MNTIDGAPDAMKVACPVLAGGKAGDYFKGLPIRTCGTQLPPSEDGGLLWSKDHFLRLKVACRLKPVSFATKVA